MAVLLWALRRLQSRMNSQNSGRRLQIIETVSVGPRQKIALVRVGTHEVLVGITPTQMTSLGQLPEGSHISEAAHATPPANGDLYVA
jgi:flagellar protein FliO/FliZ